MDRETSDQVDPSLNREEPVHNRYIPPIAEGDNLSGGGHDVTEESGGIDDTGNYQPNDLPEPIQPIASYAPITYLQPPATETRTSSSEPELMNPLALGVSAYTPHASRMPSKSVWKTACSIVTDCRCQYT